MADHMTPDQRSRAMKSVKVKDGPLERLIQRELRKIGLRIVGDRCLILVMGDRPLGRHALAEGALATY